MRCNFPIRAADLSTARSEATALRSARQASATARRCKWQNERRGWPAGSLDVFLLGGAAEKRALPPQPRELARRHQFCRPFRRNPFDRQTHAAQIRKTFEAEP